MESIVSLVLPRSPPGESASTTSADVVSFVLAYMVSFLPFVDVPQDRLAVISRQISLALVGVIILSSIRRVLRGVASVRVVGYRSLTGVPCPISQIALASLTGCAARYYVSPAGRWGHPSCCSRSRKSWCVNSASPSLSSHSPHPPPFADHRPRTSHRASTSSPRSSSCAPPSPLPGLAQKQGRAGRGKSSSRRCPRTSSSGRTRR